jgi:hypothetical protein
MVERLRAQREFATRSEYAPVAALAVQQATAHRQATWPRQRDSGNRAAAEGVAGRRSAVSGTSRTARQDTEMSEMVSRVLV